MAKDNTRTRLAAALALAAIGLAASVLGAVGCDLNDPDRDVRRLFPESTGYRTQYVSFAKTGGEALYRKVEAELGDSFSGLFEKIDVPYTAYTILKDGETMGYIHGVNQKGRYGGMQVFLALDREGRILRLYFQKLTSRAAKKFRADGFTGQFKGLAREDFAAYDPAKRRAGAGSRVASIKPPEGDDGDDFHATLRGVKKNLLITHALLLDGNARKGDGR